jgi:NDP-hexose-3-ketoreductase
MAPLRFGLIACSSIARRRLLPALQRVAGAKLVRIGSRDPENAARIAAEFSAERSGTYQEVLEDPQVDAVYLSTPPGLRLEWVKKAARANKHILCEKPAFMHANQAREAVDTCRRHQVRLFENYVFKYHPQHAQIRSLIESGRIGAPRFFQSEFTYPRPPENDIRLNPDLAGGVFHDSAGYPVAAALMHIRSRPVAISCRQGRDASTGVDDNFAATIHFCGGETAQLFVGFGLHYRSRYAIAGALGRIESERAFSVLPDKPVTVALETESGLEKLPVEPADQFQLMIEAFCAGVRGTVVDGKNFEDDLLRMHFLMDAAAQSHREGRTVDLSDL